MAESLMTKELMTKVSWTGISRTAGVEKKFEFQSLERIVNFFLKVLKTADNRWNVMSNTRLFTISLLKHSNKRLKAALNSNGEKSFQNSDNNINGQISSNSNINSNGQISSNSDFNPGGQISTNSDITPNGQICSNSDINGNDHTISNIREKNDCKILQVL